MLPADLRRLECNLCPPDSKTILLAQDRYALKKHVRKEHGEMDFDKNMASYKCR